MKLAPLCLFVFNRLDETKQTINCLKKNFLAAKTDLIIFSDGPKNKIDELKVFELREYLLQVTGFKSIEIYESKKNKGLANSIIDGIEILFKKNDRVIILEDDLLTTPNFLNFMNKALDYYENDKKIQSINGFSLDIKTNSNIYFQTRPFPWGWATWKNRWNVSFFDKNNISKEIENNNVLLSKFNKKCGQDISKMLINSLNNRNDSWYVFWVYIHFKNSTVSVYPNFSFVQNIGFTIDGTHCNSINTYKYKLAKNFDTNFDFKDYNSIEYKLEKDFLMYFSNVYKISYRLKLLFTKNGFKLVLKEIIDKIYA